MKNRFNRRDALKAVVGGAMGMIGSLRAEVPESRLAIRSTPVELNVTTVTARTVRLTVLPAENGTAQPLKDDGALVERKWSRALIRTRSLVAPGTFRSGNLKISLSPHPFSIRVETDAGLIVQELTLDETSAELSFNLGNGHLLGLGQGGPQFDRRGQTDSMVSGQGGYQLGTHGARVPIQFLIGTDGWGMLVHAPFGAFDLSGKRGRVRAMNGDASLPVDVFIIAADHPTEILAEYAQITGYPELPPMWTFGYQQSHRTLDSPEQILAEAQTFRDKKLPCDAMIYLGTGFCPNGWNTNNGEFTWNARAFPDPAGAIEQLQREHFRVVLHIVLEGKQLTGTVNDPCSAAPLPSGRTADGQWPPDRQVSCYWPFHKPLADLGVDGWWPDQGDDLDPPSRLARIRMYYEGQQAYRPNQRVYALHRNGYVGMQRYAAFLWSGDVLSEWETLKTHVPVGINTGLSGIPFWGTDIGGFIPTEEYTGELYARWFQFAAFCPLFRSHGRDWKLHLPWGWNAGEIGYPETPNYYPSPEELHNPTIEPICKKYLELRYRLMPYIYSAAKETCETGLPMMRALWLYYPDDPLAVVRGDEYLFGRDFLVAPVVEKGATTRTLYLPRGTWYDFWTAEKHEGGREVTRQVDLATLPLYVRAGAVVPMGPIKQYVAEVSQAPTTLVVAPGASAESFLYEDDGSSFDFRKGESMRIEMKWNDAARKLDLRLASGTHMLKGTPMEFDARLIGNTQTTKIVFKGEPLSIAL
jgi:alpha-glucosidase (family GH31 glycosyl hydrolase)